MFGGNFATNVKTTGYELTGEMGKLLRMGGLTFYKDYTISGSLVADYARGSRTNVFTVVRSATTPATYVDSNGTVYLTTTSNDPRFQGGYYDATGFYTVDSNGKSARGLMIEAAGTNLVPKSTVFNDAVWTATTMTVTDNDVLSPDGTTNAGTLLASAGNGNILLTTAVTARTFSVWLKRKTGTGTINITANGGTTWAAVTLTSSWCRFTVTATAASQTCGVRIVTDTDAVYIWGAQFENNPYATSFIPTTAGALTRNAEVLNYAILNNRTAAQETIVIKFMLEADATAYTNPGYLIQTTTKVRDIGVSAVENDLFFRPNATDSSATILRTGISLNPVADTSYIAVGIAISATGNPNSSFYVDNVSYDSTAQLNTDWTLPNWGTLFYIGSDNAGANQLYGIIQKIAIFNRALSASEVLAVSNSM